jgi:hypothetical protein
MVCVPERVAEGPEPTVTNAEPEIGPVIQVLDSAVNEYEVLTVGLSTNINGFAVIPD